MAGEIGNLVLTEPQVDEEAGNTLRFTANEASTVNMVNYDISPLVYYRINGTGAYAQMTGQTFSLSAGDYMDIYGDNPSGFSTSTIYYSKFNATGNVTVSGNIMALISKDSQPSTIPCNYCFCYLFSGSTGITDASNLRLPANNLTSRCYYRLFCVCTSLVNAPQILPATALANDCYHSMFLGCHSLVNAPKLPAKTLADCCYQTMFNGCRSLVNAPKLPAKTLTRQCYCGMFDSCTSLVNAPTLPAKTLVSNCYYNMFYGCSSLVNAPTLPAKTLVSNCYYQMFYGCSSLSNIRAYFTTIPTTDYTDGWVTSVKASGTFILGPDASWSVVGTYGIPSGWESMKASY